MTKKPTNWRPTASLEVLQKRAAVLAGIRNFFAERNVMEVEMPVLGRDTVTDPHIESITATLSNEKWFLQSSPEYFMKRLLAAGSGSIYYLGKAFRNGESGKRHHPEFTLLEWYRQGWTEQKLIGELTDLIQLMSAKTISVQQYSYSDIFKRVTGVDPHLESLDQLQRMAAKIADVEFSGESRATCLDLIFSLVVEPELPAGLTYIVQYPACQAALAQYGKDENGQLIARRFEAFLNGTEIANGYYELTDAKEQRARFITNQSERSVQCKPFVELDEKLLAALEEGMPECAGVAVGVDRLCMELLGLKDIRQVNAFLS